MTATGAELEGAFKPSSLRNIAKTSPYEAAQSIGDRGGAERLPSARPQRAPQNAAGVAVNNSVIMGTLPTDAQIAPAFR